jgi:hypothetical protein
MVEVRLLEHQGDLMKSLMLAAVLSVFILPLAVQAEDNDACKPVFEACAAQGYAKDETAPAGKKIWLNCANEILNKNKAVEKVDIAPNSFDANNCRDYRVAKDKFDQEWAKKHKRPKA